MKKQYSIKESIQNIYHILNGQPLPEESVRLLKEELKCLKKCLAEMEEVRKKELKLAGLEEFIIPREIKLIQDEPKWSEPILLEPILFKLIRPEPKLLKIKPQKKSDGWRPPNKN